MARWTIQVTTAGLALLARATTEETTFVFTRGQAGSGTVDTSALESQTAVTDFAMDLEIASCSHTDSNAKVLLRLDNTGITTGFSLYQIGLFAKIDGDATDVLYAIAQTSEADVIPSQTESPNYLCDYALTTIISNDLEITADVDSAGYVTEVQVQEILSDYATKEYTDAAATNAKQMVDDVTSDVYIWGVSNGAVYIEMLEESDSNE